MPPHAPRSTPTREPKPRPARTAGAAGTAAALLLLLPLLSGCESVTFGGSDWRVRIGVLADDAGEEPIRVPASVVADEAFTVRVLTRGGGCDARARTTVELGRAEATITPRDSIYVGPDACPAVLRIFRHEASLSFEEEGTARVRFRVRDPETGSVVVRERSVEVTGEGG